ncbi:MAG TPA: hypothetical protein PLN41_10190 [Methanothrix sp.]|jgi:hypothetical protein|nr:hypothetical protein [Methanothrix sp.]
MSRLGDKVMPLRKSIIREKDVGDIIKDKLERRRIWQVKCRINLANTRFTEIWRDLYSCTPPLTQPEIDLLIKNDSQLNATEIKYFKPTASKRGFNNSYYKGIDQAIAYLRFGFDHVALWHIFNDNVPCDQFRDWGWRSWNFLRELRLPIDFTYFILNEETNSIRAIKTNNPGDATLLPDLEEGKPVLAWRHPNPYKQVDEGKNIRSIIEKLWEEL